MDFRPRCAIRARVRHGLQGGGAVHPANSHRMCNPHHRASAPVRPVTIPFSGTIAADPARKSDETDPLPDRHPRSALQTPSTERRGGVSHVPQNRPPRRLRKHPAAHAAPSRRGPSTGPLLVRRRRPARIGHTGRPEASNVWERSTVDGRVRRCELLTQRISVVRSRRMPHPYEQRTGPRRRMAADAR